MGLGAQYLKLRWAFRYGPLASYFRHWICPRILKSPPLLNTTDRTAEIHTLMWKGDWLEGVWALKSLYLHSGIEYALCIHEDGSLAKEEIAHLRHHFPNARVLERLTADAYVEPILRPYPLSFRFRGSNPLALKVFDFKAFLSSPRMLIVDSDILFFDRPSELLRRVSDPTFSRNSLNRDWRYGYSIDLHTISQLLPFTLPTRINSGLGLIHGESVNFEMIEAFLALPQIMSHSHRIEQTLLALCSAAFGFEMLPNEYDVYEGPTALDKPARHYTGPVRRLLYTEGINRLLQRNFLARLRDQLATS